MKKLTFVLLVLTLEAQAQLRVILKETFTENVYGWTENETPEHKVYFRNGKYHIQAPDDGWMTYISPDVDPLKDFYLEATFLQVDGKDDNGIGFVWGYDEKDLFNSFTFTSSGYYRIWCSSTTMEIPSDWRKSPLINPMGKENKLKVEQRKGTMYFYINGKLVTTTKQFPWYGNYFGFVAYTKMNLLVDDFTFANDLKIKLPAKSDPPGSRENLGTNVNSIYDEVGPKISADGKLLYFGRKESPENIGGVNDKEDIWESKLIDGKTWSKATNPGPPINTGTINNLISVSTDNNTLLFHTKGGFAFMHRTATGWSSLEDQAIHFNNESDYLEGCLSPDGKAIIFVAKLKANAYYKADNNERDIYVCVKQGNRKWSPPIHTGRVLNSANDEYSPFLSADGKTLYFATNGRPGYGDVDVFMSKRLSDDWKQWSEPVNLGLGINTVGFDAYYTLPASGDYAYMVSNIKTVGLADIIRIKLPESIKPDPVVLISGKVFNSKTQRPTAAMIRFDDLRTGKEVGEARVDPKTGDYKIALPAGKNYGYHAAAPGYLSLNENLELVTLKSYTELKKDLYLVPIEIGESIQLRNVFFVQSKAELKSESYPELDRLVKIMNENPTIEIELDGHTDNRGVPEANLLLSEQRVAAVKSYLVAKGILPARITGRGYGGTRPMVENSSEQNRQFNRRVEFKIVKK
jgi:outer membrane protein OmpA-like peptidoglycan-associated protein